jgi:hypothetical protein
MHTISLMLSMHVKRPPTCSTVMLQSALAGSGVAQTSCLAFQAAPAACCSVNLQEQHVMQCIECAFTSSKPSKQECAISAGHRFHCMLTERLPPATHHPTLHCHLSDKKSGGNLTGPATILLPTNKAWNVWFASVGYNQTFFDYILSDAPNAKVHKLRFYRTITPIILLHAINVTVRVADLKDGEALPTSLPGAGDLIVRIPPSVSNITFYAPPNGTDPTTTTNYAHLLGGDGPSFPWTFPSLAILTFSWMWLTRCWPRPGLPTTKPWKPLVIMMLCKPI